MAVVTSQNTKCKLHNVSNTYASSASELYCASLGVTARL